LDIHSPIFFAQVESLKRAIHTEPLHLIHVLVSVVTSSPGVSMRVLVWKTRAQGFQNRRRSVVLLNECGFAGVPLMRWGLWMWSVSDCLGEWFRRPQDQSSQVGDAF
jgi:hypothetical protein